MIFAASVTSLHLIMATTDTLPPFTQGYAPHSAEPNTYQIFFANAEREAEEAGVLELLQQRVLKA